MTKLKNVLHTVAGKICIGVLLINVVLVLYNVFKLHKIFDLTNVMLGACIAFIIIFLLYLLMLKAPKTSTVLNALLAILLLFTSTISTKTQKFTSTVTKTDEVEVVEIVVKKESKLNKDSDLSGLTMAAYIDDTLGLDRAKKILDDNNKKDVNYKLYDNMKDAYKDLLDEKIDMLVFSAFSTSLLDEEFDDYRSKVRPLFSEEFPIEKIFETKKVDILHEPFTVYLGGVDLSCNGKINGVGRGDVNILLTVNPNTKKASLQVIPRDLYSYNPVKKRSTKLSFSGKWGGVQSSVASIEHELGIKINYYAKINFDGLIALVDKIGGIDVVSHYDYVIKDYHYRTDQLNHVNGEQALMMARERKSLPLNERSRGLQQMEIIKGIFNKILQNPSYDYIMSVLDTIQDNFITSLEEDQFMDAFQLLLSMKDSLTNLEIHSMEGEYNWHDDEIITGYFYYFYPAKGEIEAARNRINDILLGK